MTTLELEEQLKSWTHQQKWAAMEALVRELLPEVVPTEAERAADAEELARRIAMRDQAVDIDEFLNDELENDSSPAQ